MPRIPKAKPKVRKPPPLTGGLSAGLVGSGRDQWKWADRSDNPMPMASTYVPMWVQVLRRCKMPVDVVMIDFETYFNTDYSLGSQGSTIVHVMDPRFEVLCVSVLEMKGKAPFAPIRARCGMREKGAQQQIDHLKRQYGENLERCVVSAQNARYDLTILSRKYGINPPHVVDTLGLALAWNCWTENGLASLCERHGLPAKGDTKRFKGMTFRPRPVVAKSKKKRVGPPVLIPVPSDEQEIELRDYANGDVEQQWRLFTILLPLLSRPEVELPLMQHTLRMFLDPTFEVDENHAVVLERKFNERLQEAIQPSGLTLTQVRGRSWDDTMHAALEAAGDKPTRYTKPLKPTKSGKGPTWKIASAKADEAREWLLEHKDPTVRKLMDAKVAAGSWPNHVRRVQRIVEQCRASGGTLPVPLIYCGAHTGRWSGNDKINLQNLSSRGEDLLNSVRNLLVAPEGKELVIVDLSAIEARGLAYMAGQTDLVERFRNGEEIYCRFAEQVLKLQEFCLRKATKADPPGLAKYLTYTRNIIGKTGVLGAGYGMGGAKAVSYAGGMFDLAMGIDIVTTYRKTNPMIVQFWKDIERAFVYALKYGERVEMARGLSFHRETEHTTGNTVVVMTLPSGRELKYHNVYLTVGKYGEEIRLYNESTHKEIRMWGGHLTENAIQAMCRDLLAEAIITLDRRGYVIPLHIHDEIILMVDKGQGQRVLTEAVEVMSTPPAWAPDIPLGAEGTVSPVFGGH